MENTAEWLATLELVGQRRHQSSTLNYQICRILSRKRKFDFRILVQSPKIKDTFVAWSWTPLLFPDSYDCPCSMFILSLTLAFTMARALAKPRRESGPSPRVVLVLAAPSAHTYLTPPYPPPPCHLWHVMSKERRKSRPIRQSAVSCLIPPSYSFLAHSWRQTRSQKSSL